MLELLIVIIIGRIKAISTSKIKKIIAIRKNRIEKGMRDVLNGWNPHSKGDIFSWFEKKYEFFFLKIVLKIITIKEIKKINMVVKNKLKIIYIKFLFKPYDWKSWVLFILYKFIFLASSSVNRNKKK